MKPDGGYTGSILHADLSSRTCRTEALSKPAFEGLVRSYYAERGWDEATGEPPAEVLQELGLLETAKRPCHGRTDHAGQPRQGARLR